MKEFIVNTFKSVVEKKYINRIDDNLTVEENCVKLM